MTTTKPAKSAKPVPPPPPYHNDSVKPVPPPRGTDTTLPAELRLTHLPEEIVPISARLRAVFYATGGVGKTTLGVTAPKPLHIDIEGSLEGESADGAEGDEWSPHNWRDLNALYFWLKDQVKDGRYETIVVDTFDELATFMMNEAIDGGTARTVANAALLNIMASIPEQKHYNGVSRAVHRFLQQLRALDVHVVLLMHTRDADPEKGELHRRPDINLAAWKHLDKWSNMVGELRKTRDGKRTLYYEAGAGDYRGKSRWSATLGDMMAAPTVPKILSKIAEWEALDPEGDETGAN